MNTGTFARNPIPNSVSCPFSAFSSNLGCCLFGVWLLQVVAWCYLQQLLTVTVALLTISQIVTKYPSSSATYSPCRSALSTELKQCSRSRTVTYTLNNWYRPNISSTGVEIWSFPLVFSFTTACAIPLKLYLTKCRMMSCRCLPEIEWVGSRTAGGH